ncbi:DUF418 domain-containing protein [Deinococcus radiodurans]|nr:DUF418 domain-containing protein [Deinococcus radiodurans]
MAVSPADRVRASAGAAARRCAGVPQHPFRPHSGAAGDSGSHGRGPAQRLGVCGCAGPAPQPGPPGHWRLFAASGRTALTNYLTQSLVMTTVFYPYTGAQWGRWGAADALGLALLVGLAQLP